MLFWGFLAHLEQKNILKFFHLATHHHKLPLLPFSSPCNPPSLTNATNYLCTPLPPTTMVNGAVMDAGGMWHQWLVVAVGDRRGGGVGGNSGVGLR